LQKWNNHTDLNSLIIFAEVAQANSFSEAARRLKMPTSTVSRRIADLETQLAVRLLDRSTRGLRLTDVGSELLEHSFFKAWVNLHVTNKYLQATSKSKRLAQDKLVDAILPTGLLPKTNLIQ
jgi:molybdenum-dependent DNA-binding transcriptional regulator ModE